MAHAALRSSDEDCPPVVALTPGPVHVRAEVLAAMATPPIPHRSPEFRAVVERVQTGLAAVLGTRAPVVPVLSTATTAIESAIAAVARRRVLALVNGSFGERWAALAASLGFEVETLSLPHGEAFDADLTSRALAAGTFDTVVLVHSETSTGALSDLEGIAAAVRARPGVALVADAVSSFGALDIRFDTLGPDVVLVGSTGKGLACPPGMAVVAVAPGAAERAKSADPSRGPVTLRLETLLKWHARAETPQTPPTCLFHALDVQLPALLAEGMPARAARHRAMADRAAAWAERRFALLAAPGRRSPAVTVIENTTGLDVGALVAGVERRGYRISDGHGALAGATFRIGHLGDVTPADLEGCLAALDAELARAGSGRA